MKKKATSSRDAGSSPTHEGEHRRSPEIVRKAALTKLDELLDLYHSTDSKLGVVSEVNKIRKAVRAMTLAAEMTLELTEWAEDHFLGGVYRCSKSADVKTVDWNSHENEIEVREPVELPLELYREYIAVQLLFSMRPASDWRLCLADELLALNEGEALLITKPSKTRKHGRPHTLTWLRQCAVLHVYALLGRGLKKYRAEQEVADKINVGRDTLRAR